MPSAPFGNDLQKVEGYQRFWNRGEARRPLVGFTLRGFFPMEEYAVTQGWPTDTYLEPEMVAPETFLEDEERLLAEGALFADDIFRGDMPAAAAIPWLSGMLGAKLRILAGQHPRRGPLPHLGGNCAAPIGPGASLVQEVHRVRPGPGATFPRALPREPRLHDRPVRPPRRIARTHPEHPRHLGGARARPGSSLASTSIFEEINVAVWNHLPRFAGGYFDGMYQLWSPGPIIRIQEDASGLYSPALYRKFLQPLDRYLASRFASAFIHLHSTSMFILEAFLEIEELRCFEINNDAIGPPLDAMVPYFQMVQAAGRSLLLRGTFTLDDIRLLMDSLDPRGLYLLILVKNLDEAEHLRPLLRM